MFFPQGVDIERPEDMERPDAVNISVIALAAIGGLSLLGSGFLLEGTLAPHAHEGFLGPFPGFVTLGKIFLAMAVWTLPTAVGLFFGCRWAAWSTVLFAVFLSAASLPRWMKHSFPQGWDDSLSLWAFQLFIRFPFHPSLQFFTGVAWLIYFCRPTTWLWFNKPPALPKVEPPPPRSRVGIRRPGSGPTP